MNYKVTYKTFDEAQKAAQMFQLRQQTVINIFDGKFREARKAQKKLAKMAVENFDTYTTLPNVNFKMNISPKEWFPMLLKSMKFKIFKAFTKTSPEEKLLAKKYKIYTDNLTEEEKLKKKIDITIPSLY